MSRTIEMIRQEDEILWAALDKLYDKHLSVDEAFRFVTEGNDPEFEVLRKLPRWALHRWCDPNYG